LSKKLIFAYKYRIILQVPGSKQGINLASGGLNNDIKLLAAGLDYLKRHRDDNGKWKGFPYFYTLYVLNEIDKVLAMDEMRYAAKIIERRLKGKKIHESKYELRRNYICEQILDKVNII
jgi:hypothetical protein